MTRRGIMTGFAVLAALSMLPLAGIAQESERRGPPPDRMGPPGNVPGRVAENAPPRERVGPPERRGGPELAPIPEQLRMLRAGIDLQEKAVKIMGDPLLAGQIAITRIKDLAMKSQRPEVAVDMLRRVAGEAPHPALKRSALFALSDIFEKTGRLGEAIEAMGGVLRIGFEPSPRPGVTRAPGGPMAPGAQRGPGGVGGPAPGSPGMGPMRMQPGPGAPPGAPGAFQPSPGGPMAPGAQRGPGGFGGPAPGSPGMGPMMGQGGCPMCGRCPMMTRPGPGGMMAPQGPRVEVREGMEREERHGKAMKEKDEREERGEQRGKAVKEKDERAERAVEGRGRGEGLRIELVEPRGEQVRRPGKDEMERAEKPRLAPDRLQQLAEQLERRGKELDERTAQLERMAQELQQWAGKLEARERELKGGKDVRESWEPGESKGPKREPKREEDQKD